MSNYHYITPKIDDGEMLYYLSCSAPEGSDCRSVCVTCSKEISVPFHGDIADHETKDVGFCLELETLCDEDIEKTFDGKETVLKPGPIIISFSEEGFVWHYAEEVSFPESKGDKIKRVAIALWKADDISLFKSYAFDDEQGWIKEKYLNLAKAAVSTLEEN